MIGCTMYSALDLVDGYYQLLMRASNIPFTAVSTPSGLLWEWLVMPQGMSYSPATFNRLVTQLFRPHRDTHRRTLMIFLSIVVPIKVGQMLQITSVICEPYSSTRALINCTPTCLNVILVQRRFLFSSAPKLHFIGKHGLRADPAKFKAIVDWPIPKNQKDLRKWLGLANNYTNTVKITLI